MKKKILISLVACFIAAGSFIGYNLTENTSRTDVSLADITVMAQAQGESGDNNRGPMCYDDNWKAGCRHEEGFCSTAAKAICN